MFKCDVCALRYSDRSIVACACNRGQKKKKTFSRYMLHFRVLFCFCLSLLCTVCDILAEIASGVCASKGPSSAARVKLLLVSKYLL